MEAIELLRQLSQRFPSLRLSPGFVPDYMRNVIKTRLVRFDVEHETPIRNAQGFCTECAHDEVGEAIGRIDDERGRFEGYSKDADTKKKILRDVFEKGDTWLLKVFF